MVRELGLAVVFAVVAGTPRAAVAASVVLEWNGAFLQAVRATQMAPPMVARAAAIVHTCEYDAWAAYSTTANGTRLGGTLRRPANERSVENKAAAISVAAYRALVDLFPSQQALFDQVMTGLGLDPGDLSEDVTTPVGVGNVACGAVLEWRHGDGANQLGDQNTARRTRLHRLHARQHGWHPQRSQQMAASGRAGIPGAALAPRDAVCDRVARGDPARAAGALPVPGLRQAGKEILNLGARLDDRDKAIATYWADGPGRDAAGTLEPACPVGVAARRVEPGRRRAAVLPAGQRAARRQHRGMGLQGGLRLGASRHGHQVSYAGTQVDTWARARIDGSAWVAYIATPPFAEYVSGHSTFSAASATILRLFTGSPRFGASATVAAGSSPSEPGSAPATDITLDWTTLTRR